MAGVTLEFDNRAALAVMQRAAEAMRDPAPMLRDMGEYLMLAHDARFATKTAPDGSPWQALSPGYLKRKKKNRDKILVLDRYLSNTLRYQVGGDELVFGSNRPYAAIQHFGGEIQIAARSQQAYFRQGKDGEVGNRFVQKKKSNFAQWVTLGAYTIRIPARPFLGTSPQDDDELLAIAQRHLDNALSGATE
jgi:phage virion morphogenesis protein